MNQAINVNYTEQQDRKNGVWMDGGFPKKIMDVTGSFGWRVRYVGIRYIIYVF